ncbi:MAG: cytochrome c oxidase assembly factor 1 family protein [Planctomycetaceae bacterium]|nr:cytochrome c oxidase assembly factor 1 family protein [Planctomycetaceae bacterium]
MNGNQPIAPQSTPPQPSRALSPGAIAALVTGAFLATVAVFGLCAGLVFLGTHTARDTLERVTGPLPAVAANPNVNDWWTQRVLSEVYSATVDKVVADKGVTENLGEPVETDLAAEQFRRLNTGALSATSETIEFDILGPRARGTVSVEASGVGAGPIKVNEIKVTLEDGTLIDVNPPAEWNVNVR